MLVTFSTKAHANVTFLGDVGRSLLQLMGQSGDCPGAILAAEVPLALMRLQQALSASKQNMQTRQESILADSQHDDDDEPVSLANRALPLISLLQQAIKTGCYVMWQAN
ncbi:MAG: DUF1840 domain-containing protein [Legionella sp.]